MATLLMILLSMVGIFLIMIILIQRGRGGGLSGALTGMGGNSAFGSKAGDAFTKITMWTATLWIVLCTLSVTFMKSSIANSDPLDKKDGQQENAAPVNPGLNSSGSGDEAGKKTEE